MKRRHSMPFGAESHDNGRVRFRLWAPAAHQVDLCIADATKPLRIPLQPDTRGWFEVVTDAAKHGTQYYYRINDEQNVPDPASRFQPQDVHGPSEVIDPDAFEWKDSAWHGRPWEEAVIYELHVGAFTPFGTFSSVRDRLDYLVDLGITALELMPVADFAGQRNWGYDGVFPFAPDSTYGRPEDLKKLVQSAHERGMMILLDVVYNHFGPSGNRLRSYAPQFFTERHRTPWGDAINFDGPESRSVRDFFIHNALYWLTEYHFDGLRLDAVHAIVDDSTPHILTELADAVRSSIASNRQVHLILENDRNQAGNLQRTKRCQPQTYTAQWNDDIHHAMHVLTTGERDGYYLDYADRPIDQLGRCLVSGFAYQGESSSFRKGEPRGEPTTGLPSTAFISFLQNHDQIGNRALGERIVKSANPHAVRTAMATILLAPSTPLVFMGEEFGAETPFLFFCDFEGNLAAAVTAGRRQEFAHFPAFSDDSKRERIPDPNSIEAFQSSKLEWSVIEQPGHQDWLSFYRNLLNLRRLHIVPRLFPPCSIKANYETHKELGLTVQWEFSDRSKLILLANFGAEALSDMSVPSSPIIYASDKLSREALNKGTLAGWSAVWFLQS